MAEHKEAESADYVSGAQRIDGVVGAAELLFKTAKGSGTEESLRLVQENSVGSGGEDRTDLEGGGGFEERKCEGEKRKKRVQALALSLTLFGTFALVQLTFAFLSHSLALLGDSSTMVVDATTYGLNLFAEWKKFKLQGRNLSMAERLRLEVYIPLVSVSALVIVVSIIASSAISTLVGKDLDNVNEDTAELFALLNLAIDLICIAFYLGKGLLDPCLPSSLANGMSADNVNMYSALTHLFADTLRSLTVLFSSMYSKANPSISSNRVDGVAALFVSLIIAVVTVPLFRELWNHWVHLKKENPLASN